MAVKKTALQEVLDVQRRGKFLWFDLDDDDALIGHLGMSGQLLMEPTDASDEKHLRVRVRFDDNGPGIPAAQRRQVFDPFFTTKPVGQGTGLGLSISHGIMERHGGRLSVVESAAGGARFLIDLPAAESDPGSGST